MALLILFNFGGASAKNVEAPFVLRWHDVQSFGRAQKNPAVSAAKSEVRAQLEALGVPQAEWFPAVGIETSVGRERSDKINSAVPPASQGQYAQTEESYLVVTQNLFNGFSTVAKQSLAEAKLERAKQNLALEEAAVRRQARKNFFQAWHQQKRVQYYSDLTERLQKNLQLVKLKYSSGLEGKWAVNLLEVQKGSAELEVRNAKQLFEDSLSNLRTLLGVDFQSREVGLPTDEFLSTSEYLSKKMTQRYLENHPQVKLYNSDIKQRAASKSQSQSDFLPKLDLNFKKGVANSTLPNLPGVENDSEQVQLKLTWNLFTGGATKNSVDSADQTLAAATQHRQNALLQLQQDIDKQSQLFQLLKERYLNKSEERKVLKIRSDTVTSQYQLGTRKYADWEVAQTKLAEVEKEFLDIEEALLEQRASLEGALGIRWEE